MILETRTTGLRRYRVFWIDGTYEMSLLFFTKRAAEKFIKRNTWTRIQ